MLRGAYRSARHRAARATNEDKNVVWNTVALLLYIFAAINADSLSAALLADDRLLLELKHKMAVLPPDHGKSINKAGDPDGLQRLQAGGPLKSPRASCRQCRRCRRAGGRGQRRGRAQRRGWPRAAGALAGRVAVRAAPAGRQAGRPGRPGQRLDQGPGPGAEPRGRQAPGNAGQSLRLERGLSLPELRPA